MSPFTGLPWPRFAAAGAALLALGLAARVRGHRAPHEPAWCSARHPPASDASRRLCGPGAGPTSAGASSGSRQRIRRRLPGAVRAGRVWPASGTALFQPCAPARVLHRAARCAGLRARRRSRQRACRAAAGRGRLCPRHHHRLARRNSYLTCRLGCPLRPHRRQGPVGVGDQRRARGQGPPAWHNRRVYTTALTANSAAVSSSHRPRNGCWVWPVAAA